MDNFELLRYFNKFAGRTNNFWDGFSNQLGDALDLIQETLNKYSSFFPRNDFFSREKIYTLAIYNIDNLLENTLTRENFVTPPPTKNFLVQYQQNFSEYGKETGSNAYEAISSELAISFAEYDEYNGDFDYDFDDRDVHDYESENFQVLGADEIKETIKESVKKILNEQYLIFIRKHN